jgi:hypothetical protein
MCCIVCSDVYFHVDEGPDCAERHANLLGNFWLFYIYLLFFLFYVLILLLILFVRSNNIGALLFFSTVLCME